MDQLYLRNMLKASYPFQPYSKTAISQIDQI